MAAFCIHETFSASALPFHEGVFTYVLHYSITYMPCVDAIPRLNVYDTSGSNEHELASLALSLVRTPTRRLDANCTRPTLDIYERNQ
jgi:hypothetical protein